MLKVLVAWGSTPVIVGAHPDELRADLTPGSFLAVPTVCNGGHGDRAGRSSSSWPPPPPTRGFRDACLKVEIEFSLGFSKPSSKNPFAHPSSFGAPGAGGSFAFADPHAEVGYAYVPNRMGAQLEDPREAALRREMYRAIGETEPYAGQGAA